MQSTWNRVDQYFKARLLGRDSIQEQTLKTNAQAALPPIDVSALQGQFLYMLVKMMSAENVLEIGTLGGYSTIWMARALPENGRLISIEISDKNASIARENIHRAGLDSKVEVRVGRALEVLEQLRTEQNRLFDFIFIDADKANTANYFRQALGLSRLGTVIVVDNVVRRGEIIESRIDDPSCQGVRELFDFLEDKKTICSTAIQTVGIKGHDGFLMARIEGDDEELG